MNIEFRLLEIGGVAPVNMPYCFAIAKNGEEKTWAVLQYRLVQSSDPDIRTDWIGIPFVPVSDNGT